MTIILSARALTADTLLTAYYRGVYDLAHPPEHAEAWRRTRADEMATAETIPVHDEFGLRLGTIPVSHLHLALQVARALGDAAGCWDAEEALGALLTMRVTQYGPFRQHDDDPGFTVRLRLTEAGWELDSATTERDLYGMALRNGTLFSIASTTSRDVIAITPRSLGQQIRPITALNS
jgi:hypothetical protein